MSLSRLKTFRSLGALLCLLALAACGFEPLYGTHNAGGQDIALERPDIAVANIPNRDGQYLRNKLIDQLYTHGRPDAAKYTLSFTPLDKTTANLGIQKDASATRVQMQILTHMTLTENSTGKKVLERDLKSFGAYNLLDNQLATLVSQQSITESILQEIKDNAVRELDLYFRRHSGEGS